jgi:antitoxin component YwqK of YwqJK toxin-antitoxin module
LEENHKEGKRHGMYTAWYKNGQKKYEAMYKEGLRDGITNRWFENGQQQLESMYKDDKLLNDSYKKWSSEGELIILIH